MDYDLEKANLYQKVGQLEKELAVARRCARLWKSHAKYFRKQFKVTMRAVAETFGYKAIGGNL